MPRTKPSHADLPLPAGLRVTAEFGFVDDYGDPWHWNAGDLIRNPEVVRLVHERGELPVEPLSE